MLTAKIEDNQRIEGFKLGCDDYVCKLFNVIELVFRVKSILKRSKIKDQDDVVSFGNKFEISKLSHEVSVRGKRIILTNTEYKLKNM